MDAKAKPRLVIQSRHGSLRGISLDANSIIIGLLQAFTVASDRQRYTIAFCASANFGQTISTSASVGYQSWTIDPPQSMLWLVLPNEPDTISTADQLILLKNCLQNRKTNEIIAPRICSSFPLDGAQTAESLMEQHARWVFNINTSSSLMRRTSSSKREASAS